LVPFVRYHAAEGEVVIERCPTAVHYHEDTKDWNSTPQNAESFALPERIVQLLQHVDEIAAEAFGLQYTGRLAPRSD
jgi:hypothetical protein